MEVPRLSSSILICLSVAMVVSSTSLPAEKYWKQVLPNTPMPKAIRDSLNTNDDVGVGVGKGGVQVHATDPKSKTGVEVGKGGIVVNVHGPKSNTGVHVGLGGTSVNVHKPKGSTSGQKTTSSNSLNTKDDVGVSVGKGGVQVHATDPKSKTGVEVGKGGIAVNVHGPKSSTGVRVGQGGTSVNVHGPKGSTGGQKPTPSDSLNTKDDVGVSVGKGGVQVHATDPKSKTGVEVGKGGIAVNVHGPKSNTGVRVGQGGTSVNVHGPKGSTGSQKPTSSDSLNAKDDVGVSVGKGGVHVHATGPKSKTGVEVGKGGTAVNVHGPKSKTGVEVGKGGTAVNVHGPKSKTRVHVGKGGTSVNVHGPKSNTGVHVGKGGTTVHAPHAYVSAKPGPKGFLYKYAATETQLHDDPNAALFFLEKDLTTPMTRTMKLRFTKDDVDATSFLPRGEAEAAPFSSDKMSEILDRLDVVPGSAEAAVMESTVKECEEKPVKGEDKKCVASLEGMVDYATSKLGTRVSAVSTEAGDNKEENYKIVKATRLGHEKEARAVVCHKQSYAYAVFYCHESETTRVYEVLLDGPEKKEVKAVAVCHTDTSEWNPNHLAFKVLKVKPGKVPICHFLPEDHVVWVSK